MNEYAVRSMLMDISAGKRIVVVERTHREVHEAVRVIAAENERIDWGAVVRRTNGEERVSAPGGGWIVFATPLSYRMRGLSADVVFIDNDADRVLEGDFRSHDRFWEDVPCVLATGGKVVRS